MFDVEYQFAMPESLAVTRSARWVSNFANVPRSGLRPLLLLDLAKPQVHATLDTQRTLLNGVVKTADWVRKDNLEVKQHWLSCRSGTPAANAKARVRGEGIAPTKSTMLRLFCRSRALATKVVQFRLDRLR